MTIYPSSAICVALLALPMLSLACDNGSAGPARSGAGPAGGSGPGNVSSASRPSFQVGIAKVRVSWADGQQTFTMTLTNTGERLEAIHAIVYGRNEDMNPPRRAL